MKLFDFNKESGATHTHCKGWLGGINPRIQPIDCSNNADFIYYAAWGDGDSVVEDMDRARKLGRCIFLVQGDKCYAPKEDDGHFYFVTHLHSDSTAKQFQVPYPYHASLKWWRENKDKTFDKKYLASFMGSMSTNPDRRRLLEIAAPDIPIIERDGWQAVNNGDWQCIKEHDDLVAASYYTFCPRGIGPSSIRVIESIFRGSIPVMLDDWSRPFGRKMSFALRDTLYGNIPALLKIIGSYQAEDIELARLLGAKPLALDMMKDFRDSYLLRDENAGTPNDIGYVNWILDQVEKI